MEKIIATETPPDALNSALLNHIENNQELFCLEDAIVYYGFPLFKDYENKSFQARVMILSRKHGVVLIHPCSQHNIAEDDECLEQIFSSIEASIKKSKILRLSKRELVLDIESYLYCMEATDNDVETENDVLISYEDVDRVFSTDGAKPLLTDVQLNECRSIIEGAKALNSHSQRTPISDDPNNKLNILIQLENEILNFDIEQRKIAINLINGPQRIRGLAGSGKTVVLAMKAAHIHLLHPDKKILFTFYTKSLYGLIRDLVDRFYRHFAQGSPNWENIDILHAWGGRSIDGVYWNATQDNDLDTMSFGVGRRLNLNDPFQAICGNVVGKNIRPKYDYILIDEAQDLPNEFFQICYKLANGISGATKNIVWAYDDLQSIFNVYQRDPKQLFGADTDGSPLIDLEQFKGALSAAQSNDLVLYKCYRNPLEVLITAHALGFAIYSDPVQMLENKDHWEDVGYEVVGGNELVVGQIVEIRRQRENSPLTLSQYQSPEQIIEMHCAENLESECDWLSGQISKAVNEGLKPHDILVISLDDRNAKSYFANTSMSLAENGIRSNNLLSSGAAAPPFSLDGMVTLSTVHRAKGNEAALVFVIGVDAMYPQRNMRSARNKLFTAFTRTRAWLKVSGVGDRAQFFFDEIDKSMENCPSLIFEVPDAKKIETIQRDLNSKPQEVFKLQKIVGELKKKGFTDEQIQMEFEEINKNQAYDDYD